MTPWQRRRPLLVAAGGGAAAYWVARHDPAVRPELFPWCPIRKVTGLRCPGCGGTRMAHQLLNGRLRAAWRANPVLLVFGLPLLSWLWLRWYLAARRGDRPDPVPRPVAYAALLVAVLWTVARNLAASRRSGWR